MSKTSIYVSKYSRIMLLMLICVGLTIATPAFFTFNNLLNVLQQSSMLLIMSLGMMFAMLLGRGVDMSIGSVVALTSCIGALFMRMGPGPEYTMLGVSIAIFLGIFLGALNGSLIAYLKLPAILVTFGTREIIRGIAFYMMSDTVIVGLPRGILFLGTGRVWGIPMPIIIAVTLTLLAAFVLIKTGIGRKIYIVGANPMAAKFSGIHVNQTIILAFIISSLLATIAGIVFIGRLGAAEPQIGDAFAFQAVSAVAIGGTSFRGGIGSAGGVVIGALIITLLLNGMNLLNISSFWQGTVSGMIVILAVLLDYFARRKTM